MTQEKQQKEQKNPDLPPPIVLYGNLILNQRASEIDFESNEVEDLDGDIIEMIATMYSYGGIGLAGPQINIMKRIIIWDHKWMTTGNKYENLNIMINPKIINQSEEDIGLYESCLSIPEVTGSVYRSKEVTIRYIDIALETKEELFKGVDARIIQHEIDHLDGKLFINQMTGFERDEIVPFLVALRQAHKKYHEEGEK
jgi:peptide deformylase